MDNPFADPSIKEASNRPAAEQNFAIMEPTSNQAPPSWLSAAEAADETPEENYSYDTVPGAKLMGEQTMRHDPMIDADNEPKKKGPDLPKLILYMRLANVALSALMITSAVTSALMSASLSNFIIGAYVSCFGCLFCCYETHLKQVSVFIADNFGFLYNAKARCLFMMLIATLCYTLNIIGMITAFLCVAAVCLNVYVLFKHPHYQDQIKNDDLHGKGPETIQDMASQYAVSYARENPDQVQAAARSAGKWAYENPDVAVQGANAFASAQNQDVTYSV